MHETAAEELKKAELRRKLIVCGLPDAVVQGRDIGQVTVGQPADQVRSISIPKIRKGAREKSASSVRIHLLLIRREGVRHSPISTIHTLLRGLDEGIREYRGFHASREWHEALVQYSARFLASPQPKCL